MYDLNLPSTFKGKEETRGKALESHPAPFNYDENANIAK